MSSNNINRQAEMGSALKELNTSAASSSSYTTVPLTTPSTPRNAKKCHCESGKSCYMHALKAFINAFSIGFGFRSCLSLLLRIIALTRKNPKHLFDLQRLLGEKNLSMRVDAVRLGLFVGGFAGGYNLLFCLFSRIFDHASRWPVLLAGFGGGLSILSQPRASQRTLALYVMARFVQCLYNDAKRRQWFTPIPHGDSLLFALSSAQIMYAYVMRPETLPSSYFQFIVNTGPIDVKVLTMVKDTQRGLPVSAKHLSSVSTYLAGHNTAFPYKLGQQLPMVSCNVLHPMQKACSKNWLRIFSRAFNQTFPLYLSLTFVPMLVLRFFPFMKSPFYNIGKGFLSAARSSSFLGGFCMLYQFTICNFRNLGLQSDNRYYYWFAGLIASLSIFMEKKSRRAELGLYTMPRAMDSLFLSLVDRKWLMALPRGEVLLFMLSMAGIMYHNRAHPDNLSNLVKTILRWLGLKQSHTGLASSTSATPVPIPVPATVHSTVEGEQEERKTVTV